MVDLTDVAAAFSALNAAKEIGSAMIGLHDSKIASGKAGELNGKLIEAQQLIFSIDKDRTTLIETVRDLKEKIISLEAWNTEKEKYELTTLPNCSVLAYRRKEAVQPQEPVHYICARCYEDGQKSILQSEQRVPVATVFVCHRCGAELYSRGMRHAAHGGATPSRRK